MKRKVKQKKKLEIESCLTLGNARRMELGKSPIKSMRRLAINVADENESSNNIYFKIYRYQKTGFINKPHSIIEKICDLLIVSEQELISKY
jgi:hypothetical protein